MNFVLFVEGGTEREALRDFLQRWLHQEGRLDQRVGVRLRNLKGWSNIESKGVRSIQAELDGPSSGNIIAAIGLLDLYGPTFYPDNAGTARERYDAGVRKLEREVNRPRFHMFFAVHETEAWLLSQPQVFPKGIREKLQKHQRQPENVNHTNPPAERISEAYRTVNRTYRKTLDGQDLFSKLNPDEAYAACPYLKRMLDTMLRLAQTKPNETA